MYDVYAVHAYGDDGVGDDGDVVEDVSTVYDVRVVHDVFAASDVYYVNMVDAGGKSYALRYMPYLRSTCIGCTCVYNAYDVYVVYNVHVVCNAYHVYDVDAD